MESSLLISVSKLILRLAIFGIASAEPIVANATPHIVVDAGTGEVLSQEQATQVWYPASLTKLMTVYVALKSVREGKVTLDTPFVMSRAATKMAPSKMGFKAGTEVTLDNAMKMLMVKSANDIAVMIAEGIGGSVDEFADLMNANATRLGMHESHFVNPNGLPDPRQTSSARDMAILARALYTDFPEQADLFGIGALQLGSSIIPTHNGLIGRYPGGDGMKTGFTCAAGFNVVASATRNGRKLIAVVLGESSAKIRTAKTATLLDQGFSGTRSNASDAVTALASQGTGTPPDMRAEVCSRKSKAALAREMEDFTAPIAAYAPSSNQDRPEQAFLLESAGLVRPAPAGGAIALLPRPAYVPVPVFVGRKPDWTGPVAQARITPGASIPGVQAKPVTAALVPAALGKVPSGGKSTIDAAAYNPFDNTPLRLSGASTPDTTDTKTAKPVKKPNSKVASRTKPEGQLAQPDQPVNRASTLPISGKGKRAAKPARTKAAATKPSLTKPVTPTGENPPANQDGQD